MEEKRTTLKPTSSKSLLKLWSKLCRRLLDLVPNDKFNSLMDKYLSENTSFTRDDVVIRQSKSAMSLKEFCSVMKFLRAKTFTITVKLDFEDGSSGSYKYEVDVEKAELK